MRYKSRIVRLVLPLIVSTTASCSSSHALAPSIANPTNWTNIAAISGDDAITEMHITNLLKSHGIDSLIEGSLLYGVSVPEEDANRSIAILQNDLQHRHYWIFFGDLKSGKPYLVPESDWIVLAPREKYSDLIHSEDFREGTNFGGMLRSDDIKQAATGFPYVTEIRYVKREYLGPGGQSQIGYDVRFKIGRESG